MNTSQIGTTHTIGEKGTLQDDAEYPDSGQYRIALTHLGSGVEQGYYINSAELTRALGSVRYPIAQLEQKEKFFITGFKNLLKKVNFLELHQKHLNQLITAEEFESEIHNKPHFYTIDINNTINENTVPIVLGIVDKVKGQLEGYSFNDVSEIFSLPPNSVKGRFVTIAEE